MIKIDVLLATYNGSKFVKEQITSVLANFDKLPGVNCRLLISDDGSSDDTIAIINELELVDSRIILIDKTKKGGVRQNFNYLINNCDADYVFFCDQDDLWLPNKMSIFLDRFLLVEKDYSGPVLVHSDLCVADKNLSPMNISMFEYQKINKMPSFTELIISNSITGCVMACNRTLICEIKKSHISNSIMHDWYVGIYAAAYGRISFIDSSLILYRQHGGNQVGAKSFSTKDIFNFVGIKDKLADARLSVQKTHEQAKLFYNDFGNDLEPNKRKDLHDYIDSFDTNFLCRLKLFSQRGFRKTGRLRNFIFFLVYILKI
ncbi:TPA: glycosyltransferase family 2 protein [Klebsiella quasipneumoniae subsp. quasipneumoniae]|uniref:glycosyltransferase family 2 protein n=1 Tax=Raoultella ornithinolytica TaxID=54291 RepID=UPI0015DBF4DD|nr:glycosyltransferase family 2 protein [Raoultella ornithinolytica]HBR0925857.1 glycosyltransferase family 2 protein [Klebsiella quasipneumoniae subsp. quasipneumoniae]MDK7651741.1 glycosyltransferase family 2 protein [Raoultella ornithinolytica]MDK7660641.1 glycosyltransferase family 2 protein [Raoultella ornithinolytica]BBQ88598.1 rhamnosyltransferase [Raoultella ornithinolytica]HBR1356482.1 glycosyltransferase family 2 protein [Klebsiella quasipneumoniae subsp. quasipneumoniae]